MEVKFNLDEIEKTFTHYKKGESFDGVVVLKRDDGLIFNIGGKNDAFIPKEDFENYDAIKVGERFKVIVTEGKNDEGFIVASYSQAKELIVGNQNAEKLKLGSTFSFVTTQVSNGGLISKLGSYKIFIPLSEVSINFVKDFKVYVGKRVEALVTEINHEDKTIIGSIKMLESQEKVTAENNFWNAIFINKIVKGKVVRFAPYGAFVNVDGVDCLAHISDLSYERINSPEEVLQLNKEYLFRVVKVDKENKKVSLGIKQLEENPLTKKIEAIAIGDTFDGVVTKILPFGAIIKTTEGISGLLHISAVTDNKAKNIYEFVKLNENVKVEVISKDSESLKIGFKLCD